MLYNEYQITFFLSAVADSCSISLAAGDNIEVASKLATMTGLNLDIQCNVIGSKIWTFLTFSSMPFSYFSSSLLPHLYVFVSFCLFSEYLLRLWQQFQHICHP
jgi:hypothetical protein